MLAKVVESLDGLKGDYGMDETFDNRIKELRAMRNMSQTKLAKQINVTSASISQYESGKRLPTLNIAISLADVFQVSLDDLFRGVRVR